MSNSFHDIETIYALGLDELMFGADDGNSPELTPSDREALAAIGAEAFVGGHDGPSMWLGLSAMIRSLFG